MKKEGKCINFDRDVLKALEFRCKKNNTKVSSFVNYAMRNLVIDPVSFAREKAKHHAAESMRWQTEIMYLEGR